MLYQSILYLPLLSFLVLGFACLMGLAKTEKIKDGLVIFSTVCLGLSVVCTSVVFYNIFLVGYPPIVIDLFSWFDVSSLQLNIGMLLDKLSVVMLFVVSLISFLVHVYSLEYMKHDESKVRFFSYLGLFTFVMFVLVSAPNLVQLFLGWEGVGLASYLLIGFWYNKPSANNASIKAFIVNRVADLALIAAMILIFVHVGSLNIPDLTSNIIANADALEQGNYINLIALLLFIGAMGKSAQFGFHTWLPDAMEGPTPVSALIHSATMVSAGVFLVVRFAGIFELSDILPIIGIVGMLTAIFASLVGLAQKDIKKVIAYSTCSQLGFMFFACAVGAYTAAMFHLFTHAFFKALLFLGAGSVIHSCNNEQNMFKMGGLKKLMPMTYILMWIGTLSLMGIPPFAGFFSKELILESGFMAGTTLGTWVYVVGVFGAILTAVYSCRVMFLVFEGANKLAEEDKKHVHESNLIMLVPMYVLAFGAIVAGFLGTKMGTVCFWGGSIAVLDATAVNQAHNTPMFFKYLPLMLIIAAAVLTYLFIVKNKCEVIKTKASCITKVLENKFYIDEIYNIIIVKPYAFIAKIANVIDVCVIDYAVNFISRVIITKSKNIRKLQTGFVYDYNLAFIVFVIVVLAVLIFITI